MSSDDSRSDSSSDSEDLETTGLIATRQKRATAGNLYATLRANLDDEELQKELLAEDEDEDAEDYEGSDKDNDNDDDALESSSEEEDAGPPKEGQVDDLTGEKELKKAERAEARKKRKAHDARIKVPAWRQKKKVKLADDVKTEDGSAAERPRKKSERSNWLPTAADAPTRQSGRSLAVANREVIHANLKESAARSEKQRRVMKDAAEKEGRKRWMENLTQEDRLKKCERVERETARDFGRWEREEAERQRLREEALAAKRKRGIDGPYVRQWSGSVVWVGEKIKVRRVSHGSRLVEDIVLDGELERKAELVEAEGEQTKEPEIGAPPAAELPKPDTKSLEIAATECTLDIPAAAKTSPQTSQLPGTSESKPDPSQTEAAVILLPTVQDRTMQNSDAPAISPAPVTEAKYTPSAPYLHKRLISLSQHTHPPPSTQQGLQGGFHQFSIQLPPPPPSPPVPPIREQARRSLVILSQFPTLEAQPHTTKRNKATSQKDASLSNLETDPLKSVLLGADTYPTFSSESAKYLTTRPKKRANELHLPPAPPKRRCAVTSWVAKFRDPKTGLAYADLHQYKIIQRVLAGGCQWSSLLGCWVGPAMGPMGRAARGVPEGFAGVTAVKTEAKT